MFEKESRTDNEIWSNDKVLNEEQFYGKIVCRKYDILNKYYLKKPSKS